MEGCTSTKSWLSLYYRAIWQHALIDGSRHTFLCMVLFYSFYCMMPVFKCYCFAPFHYLYCTVPKLNFNAWFIVIPFTAWCPCYTFYCNVLFSFIFCPWCNIITCMMSLFNLLLHGARIPSTAYLMPFKADKSFEMFLQSYIFISFIALAFSITSSVWFYCY